ncbi:adenosylmethionine--8-amino-7-oxononanoate transaminase [Haliscomenobacter sp.]|uniref:adenosylmethionine--8-amino-7-oxononanoate transaminase n=1 Tax=Haliscomenobacter sp. TaxID=2717303 RepID=UPI00336506BF
MSTQPNWITRDRAHIWHPYTQMKTADAPIAIVAGKGAELFDETGKVYLDAVASWWTNIHGHAHPYMAEKLAEQARTLEHVIFAGFTHPSAIELAERLLPLLPAGQSKAFFTDNGSTAVEVGIKMAIQYFYNQGIARKKVIAFDLAYHGDTFGTMSVGGDLSFHNAFQDFLYQVERIPTPIPGQEEACLIALEEYLQKGDVAAFVFEPLVLGAGGMLMYSPDVLDQLMALCKKHGALCIADEVMTGFGRTGKLFATLHCQETPDIIALSKGLTGGMLPMALTTCTEAIYQAFYADDKMKALYHGHSFTGNPLGCAVALASLDLLLSAETQGNIERVVKRQSDFLVKIKNHPQVQNARQTGTILAIEFKTDTQSGYFNNLRDLLYRFFLQRGLILRPLGNVVYVLPPYCITDPQLDQVYTALEAALDFEW